MTESVSSPDGPRQASRGFPWLKAVLVASLALNLMFIGGAAARYFVHGPMERVSSISNMQMIPRRFFSDLDRARRTELLAIFNDFRSEFRGGRKQAREQMGTLAAALEAEPYDEAAVTAAVEAFSGSGAALMRRGGEAALVFIARLQPEERKLLARHIRMRDSGGRKHGKDDDDRR